MMPTFSIPIPSKIYPNLNFWFANKSSGNPEEEHSFFELVVKGLFKRPTYITVPPTRQSIHKETMHWLLSLSEA
jgi:hypothetical protein